MDADGEDLLLILQAHPLLSDSKVESRVCRFSTATLFSFWCKASSI